MFALTKVQWAVAGIAILVALAGLALMAVNALAILRPRKPGEEKTPRKLLGRPQQLSRRAFFRRVLGAGFALAITEGLALTSLAYLWPSQSGGFGGKIRLPDSATTIKETIAQTKQPYYFAPGRVYVVRYDAADDANGIYTDAGLVSDGLMALYQRCVHLGCRVPFCETSQWFECPCHGSKYNRAGEFRAGPAPRGLDRFPIEVADDVVTVNTGVIVTGPPRGINTTGQDPEGPFCVGVGAAE